MAVLSECIQDCVCGSIISLTCPQLPRRPENELNKTNKSRDCELNALCRSHVPLILGRLAASHSSCVISRNEASCCLVGSRAAAYASGATTSVEAIIGAYYRGLVTKQQTRPGAMAAVGLGRKDVAAYLTGGTTITCENSPESMNLSADADRVDVVIEKIKESHSDVLTSRLRVEMAYHSC